MRILSAFYLLLTAAFVTPVIAMTHHHGQHSSSVTQAHITLSDFWARASIGMAPNSGAYGQIVSTRDDRLISARTGTADQAGALLRDHQGRGPSGAAAGARDRSEEGGCAAGAARPRPPRGVQGEPPPLEDGEEGALRRPPSALPMQQDLQQVFIKILLS